ncbi:hypothetical protein [Ignatzschineria cameli]|uniref:Uncharacterized protein n=1 Tax=Ignatzschineria cameli TaxID=2182793 RepID=A0A2U2AQL0_9GAMM|nr:hypothetical protein [Ignatzschineria cameli]PWD85836.1 hypothetical protein DC077_07340 [Ignatzschineria cameli]PWD89464.1 hypothetical protein DC079_06965 [Ignatzschineria cameli]PWD90936.1 hypothetical protein DC081_06675 [Ignatzschineria cameli]PWD91724.1 hypothetical protein DC078_06960 [Ignatzschineria cameli]
MSILKIIKQCAQRHIENKRIKRNARIYKEIEISKAYSAFSLAQIKYLIIHEELKLARMFVLSPNKKQQQVLVAGLHRARNLISARAKAAAKYEKMDSIVNAPVVILQKKVA